MIELLKVLVCLPFLLYSCYSDIKTRRVSNETWVMMFAAGFIFIIYDIMNNGALQIVRIAVSFLLIFGFVYILFYFNAFGGADAKVLMVISLIIPTYPMIEIAGTMLPTQGIPPISLFTFTVFGNSVILTVIVPLGLFLYNFTQPSLSKTLRKPYYMFIGYRCPISGLDKEHIRLIEEYGQDDDGRVTSRFTTGGTSLDEDVIVQLRDYVNRGLIDDGIWVTPGLPFMIPITAGFITAVVYGDLIFQLTMSLLY
ncbi:MAG: prepilin peptidase [Methanosarcinaceae archaeon]|nr:prepilin peptidase [Methanosarcinaceae archaeon]